MSECLTCGKQVHEAIHSCKRVPVTVAAWNRKLDELTEQWHTTTPEDGYSTPLHEYLGMSFDEYGQWVLDPTAIPVRWLT